MTTSVTESCSSDASFVTDASSTSNEATTRHLSYGLSSPHLSQSRRQMLDLVDKLHNTGVNVDIDLPQIAVIGSQSAGKSSLIESISGITLPRASGTCTRCPTECRLSCSTSRWQCSVSLRYIVDSTGKPSDQVSNVPFGKTIYDKSEVEERIRRAQKAILNPTKDHNDFLNIELKDNIGDSDLSFSRNYVSIQISGPEVTDLSFCDLPGLIATDEKGSSDVKLITSLAESYIKKESCIILLTVNRETDFENQPAYGVAKKWDPQGQRTIGVLTKPDRIPIGEEASWLQLIRNERHPLKNGWFCSKQPNSMDLKAKITWAQAREAENTFFTGNVPWVDLDSHYQKYLGTGNLVNRLSVILSDLILKRIPEIEDELALSIAAVHTDLAALPPPPPENAHSEVSAMLYRFTADLKQHMEGIPSKRGLLQEIRPAQETFRQAVRATAPNFRPFERKYAEEWHISPASFLVEEEGRIWDGEESDGSVCCEDEYRTDRSDQSDLEGKERNTSTKLYIDEVMEIANDSLTRELPGHYPYTVQKSIIEGIIKKWDVPAETLCAAVNVAVNKHVQDLVTKHFAVFGQGGLAQRVKSIINKHIQDHLASARSRITWLLALEAQPFSLNTHYFADYRSKFVSYYRGQRRQHTNPELRTTIENLNRRASGREGGGVSDACTKLMAALAELRINVPSAEAIQKLLAEDEMEPALLIMADVRAYFQVAYKRFSDTVPLAIDHELVRGVGDPDEVLATLIENLGMGGPAGRETCTDLAQESPQNADKRAELKKKLERLESAQRQLMFLGA